MRTLDDKTMLDTAKLKRLFLVADWPLIWKYGIKFVVSDNFRKKKRRTEALARRGVSFAAYKNRRRKAKFRILGAKSHGRCKLCRETCPRDELSIDHIVPISNGGTNDKRNLQLICLPCHRKKDNPSPLSLKTSPSRNSSRRI